MHPAYSQTIRGVTVKLAAVQWLPFDVKDPQFPYHKSFYFNYTVQTGPGVASPPGKSLLDCVTAVTAVSPDGSQIGSGGSGYSMDATGSKKEASANWEGVDPRWPVVGIDVDFVDPAAPPRASGVSTAPITITDIPMPDQPDTVTPVHAETVTPLGTHIIVEKIKVSPAATAIKTWIVFRVVPDPAAPDLQFRGSTGGKLVDETGAVISPSGGSIGNADQLDNTPHTTNGGDWTIGFFNAPAPTAKTLRLTLSATESSVMLKQDTWYRHFHFRVPLSYIWAGDPSNHTALAAVQGVHVAASLESVGPAWGHDRARLILRDRTDPSVLWRARAVRAVDDAGNALTSQPSSNTFFWQVNGQPLETGDTAWEAILGLPGSTYDSYGTKPAPPAKTLTVTVDAEAIRIRSHVLAFAHIPVPAPGQTLTLNRQVTDDFGARLVLRKVMAYSPTHPPAGFPDPRNGMVAPAGLVVVLAEPPDSHGTVNFDFRLNAAREPSGDDLNPSSGLTLVPGDALSNAPLAPGHESERTITYLLRAPGPGVTMINLRLTREETLLMGKAESLTFPPVTAPAPSDKPR